MSANALNWLSIIIIFKCKRVDTGVNTQGLTHRNALTRSADLGRLVSCCSFVLDLDVIVLVR